MAPHSGFVMRQSLHVFASATTCEMRPPFLPPTLGLQTHNWAVPECIARLWWLRAGSLVTLAGYFRNPGVFPLGHTCVGSQAPCRKAHCSAPGCLAPLSVLSAGKV